MNRRRVLAVVGGGVILAAGGGAGLFAATRRPERALAPWARAGTAYTEPRRRALSYAILAPSSHNLQPWRVDLSQVDHVTLYADQTKLLPETDPFSRQIVISLGCFLELMRLAAAEDGFRLDWVLFPDGSDPGVLDDRPVARVRFVADPAVRPDPLFRAVLGRRSTKTPYDITRPVAETELRALEAVGLGPGRLAGTSEPGLVARLREITVNAMAAELTTPRTYRESVGWFRIGKAEVEANPDGLEFTGLSFELLHLFGLFTRENSLDVDSANARQGLASLTEALEATPSYIWLTTPGNSRIEQVAAGRDWLRINLAATVAGIGFHPVSQALQEYPEVAKLYQATHGLLARDGGTVQMLCRLGYAPPADPTPRWALEHKIIA